MIPMCDDQEDTKAPRAQGTRQAGGRARGYPSDLTDAQWQVMAAHLPADRPGRRGRVRAENLVHGSDQHGCSPGRPTVMIIDHVPAVRIPPDHMGCPVATAVPS
jgi:hypothetical protein